jgi:hypothetical protein
LTLAAAAPLLAALLLLAAPPAPAWTAHDPDLRVEGSCPDLPAAAALRAALPSRVKELLVLLPRAGALDEDGRCRAAARTLLIDHNGLLITATLVVLGAGDSRDPTGFRILTDSVSREPPRAELEFRPSEEQPRLLLRLAGAPSTSHDALAGAWDHLAAAGFAEPFARLLQAPAP